MIVVSETSPLTALLAVGEAVLCTTKGNNWRSLAIERPAFWAPFSLVGDGGR
jgi:hypothetical protein